MAQIQRNAPCPCGSGKKYKKCCMLTARQQQASALNRREGVQKALAWISAQYREPIDRWVDEVWLAELDETQRQQIGTADPRIRSIHDINLLELLVAEGRFDGVDGENQPLQLILQHRESIGLDDEQCEYLAQLAERPLRLYRITQCVPGESFTVRDCLLPDAEAISINDSYASRMFDEGDTLALRLLQTSANWETSGALYHIPDGYVAELEQQLLQAGDAYTRMLTRRWLELVAAHV